jgi:8-oxo-dGTP pyrophosphatase MutT (NUDIX family)
VPSERDWYHIGLKAILRNREGKVLVLRTPSDSAFGGKCDLPGGRINEDEFSSPLEEILKREIQEEIGSDDVTIHPRPVALGRHRFASSRTGFVRIFFIFFEVDFQGEAVTLSVEHAGYEWVDLKAIDLEQYFTSGILDGVRQYLSILDSRPKG